MRSYWNYSISKPLNWNIMIINQFKSQLNVLKFQVRIFLPYIQIVSCLTYLRLSRSNYVNKANLRMKLEITATVTYSIRQLIRSHKM